MKILFDAQTFVEQAYGGISRVFVRLAPRLQALGCEVEIHAPGYQNRYLAELDEGIADGFHVSNCAVARQLHVST